MGLIISNNNIKNFNYNNEQNNIMEGIMKICNILNFKPETFSFTLNYKYKFSNNQEIEFDSIFIIKNKYKTSIFILEHKHYLDELTTKDYSHDDRIRKTIEIKNFKNDVLNSYKYSKKQNIDFFFIFYYKNNEKENITFSKINDKRDTNFTQKEFSKKLFEITKYKYSFLTSKYIEEIRNYPRDLKFLIDSFKNHDEFQKIIDKRKTSNMTTKINNGVYCFIIEGPAGAGKTNLSCSWYSNYISNNKNAILFLINQNYSKEIKKALISENMLKQMQGIYSHSSDLYNNQIWLSTEKNIFL